VPAEQFYVAERYHQDYFQNNPNQPYCHYVVAPKVAKFREKFAARQRNRESEPPGITWLLLRRALLCQRCVHDR